MKLKEPAIAIAAHRFVLPLYSRPGCQTKSQPWRVAGNRAMTARLHEGGAQRKNISGAPSTLCSGAPVCD
jgi:hypothetical protein